MKMAVHGRARGAELFHHTAASSRLLAKGRPGFATCTLRRDVESVASSRGTVVPRRIGLHVRCEMPDARCAAPCPNNNAHTLRTPPGQEMAIRRGQIVTRRSRPRDQGAPGDLQ